MSARRGYLTLACGVPAYLEMAVDMALSLRAHTELPIAVACDEALHALARDRYASVFDEITRLPERFEVGRVRKFGTAESSPFDETVYVDADCIVLGPLDRLFDPLDTADVVMLGEQLGADRDENHHGFSTRALVRRFGLERYLKTNSGVFAFRRDVAIEAMEACRRCFLEEARPALRWSILLGRWLGDEIAFGIVGGRRGFATFPPPAPMYWPQEFDAIDVDRPSKPLLHFIWPPPEETLVALLDAMRARRRSGGVPGDPEPHWHAEVAKLTAMRRRRRFLERIGWW